MLFHSTMRGIAAALLSTLAVSATLSIPAQAQRPLRLTLGISTPVKHSGQTSQGFLFGGGNYDSTAPFLVAGLSYDLTRQTEERRPVYSAYWDNGLTLSIFSPSADFSGLGVSARFPGGSRYYYGGGLGFYRRNTGQASVSDSAARTGPGGKLFVGHQGSGIFFGQFDVTLLGSVRGTNLSHAAILLGLRL